MIYTYIIYITYTMHTYIHLYTYICIYTYIHIFTHIHSKNLEHFYFCYTYYIVNHAPFFLLNISKNKLFELNLIVRNVTTKSFENNQEIISHFWSVKEILAAVPMVAWLNIIILYFIYRAFWINQ